MCSRDRQLSSTGATVSTIPCGRSEIQRRLATCMGQPFSRLLRGDCVLASGLLNKQAWRFGVKTILTPTSLRHA
jgi:hypothetical protein